MKKKYGLLVVFMTFILVDFSGVPARAGLLEFFFPTLRKDETAPTSDGQAPFAAGTQPKTSLNDTKKILSSQNSAVPLERPHRRDEDIREWLMQAVSEIMTFDNADYRADLEENSHYFATSGKNAFNAFLSADKLLDVLKSQKYFVHTFVEETPFLLNEGPVDGRYRWLYEVPVMVTFMDRGMKDYKKSDPITQRINLRIQVGRTNDTDNETGVVIESWEGKAIAAKNTRR